MTERYLVMPRGINVGTRNRVPMAELRSKLTGDGYRDVATVLQSGNVIVSTEEDRADEVAGAMGRLLSDEFDVDVACVVRTANQVRAVLERNPLQEVVSDPSRYLVVFLSQEPDPEVVGALLGEDHSPEAIAIEGAEAYVWTPDGVTVDMSASGRGDRPLANTYWVDPGRFAAGEYPGARSRKEAAGRLRTLLRAGIDCFVDLTQPHEGLAPYARIAAQEASRLDTTFVHERHSIVDMGLPRSAQQTAGILDAIDEALGDGRNVYVHCWGGIGRTGTVVGCWLVRHGMTGDEALAQIAQWWQGMEKRYRHPRSPQTAQQRAYVRNWTEPSRGGGA